MFLVISFSAPALFASIAWSGSWKCSLIFFAFSKSLLFAFILIILFFLARELKNIFVCCGGA